MEQLPVVYQDFENEAEETRHRLASNEIARHAQLDESKMLDNLKELDLDIASIDMEEFGLIDFELPQTSEVDMPNLGDGSDPMVQQMTFTLSTEQKDIVDEAISKIKTQSECHDEINENKNGNALAEIMKLYVNS